MIAREIKNRARQCRVFWSRDDRVEHELLMHTHTYGMARQFISAFAGPCRQFWMDRAFWYDKCGIWRNRCGEQLHDRARD